MIFFDDEEAAADGPEQPIPAASRYRSGLVALAALAVAGIVVLTIVLVLWRPLLFWLGLVVKSAQPY